MSPPVACNRRQRQALGTVVWGEVDDKQRGRCFVTLIGNESPEHIWRLCDVIVTMMTSGAISIRLVLEWIITSCGIKEMSMQSLSSAE